MTVETMILGAAAALLLLALWIFGLISVAEREARAAGVAFLLGPLAASPFLVSALLAQPVQRFALGLLAALVFGLVVLWLWPVGRKVEGAGRPCARHDERDIMFARARLEPGTAEYDAYYTMRPEHKLNDDQTRNGSRFLSFEGDLADPVALGSTFGSFEVTDALRNLADGEVAEEVLSRSPQQWSSVVKDLLRYHGANDVGITELRPEHIYSHVGRGVGTWGEAVRLGHRWAIAFSVEMDHRAVATAPGAAATMESGRRYVDITSIGIQVASAIRHWGHPARAHTDGNYRVIAPLVARDAGIGDIGRMGLVMSRRHGPRVRLGAITTDLPLVADPGIDDLAMLDFCSFCKKCAENCPVGAIPTDQRQEADGELRWKIHSEACYRYWTVSGTDCASCMRVCPFSHPDNAAHNFVRLAIQRSGGARRALLWMDDLFYGRKPAPRSTGITGVP